jgi:hypothetical protein
MMMDEAMLNFREKLTAGFYELRWRHKYFAAQCFQCCQTCGTVSVPDAYADRYTFYHEQDAAALDRANSRERLGVFLAWSGNATIIRKTFEDVGCTVIHSGSPDERIWVCEPVSH